MGKRTATNENRTISTKGTIDCAQALLHTWHWVEPKKAFEGFDNSITSDHLVNGTAITTIAGHSIWILRSQLAPPSGPAHPGNRGALSGKPRQGEAEALMGSITCRAEGSPVVRMYELTLQDSRNTIGQVVPEAKPLGHIEAKGKGDGAGDGGGKAKGKGGKAKAQPARSGVPDWPPTSTERVERCEVTAMVARCRHGRSPEPTKSYIEVCHMPPTARQPREVITLRAGVNGICGNPHPVWTVQGQPQPAGPERLELSFEVPAVFSGPLKRNDTLATRPSTDLVIRCDGCTSRGHALNVKVYECLSDKWVIKVEECSDAQRLRYVMVDIVNGLLNVLVDDVGGKLPRVTPPHGDIEIAKAVQEDPSTHHVFMYWKVRADIDPLAAFLGRLTVGAGTVGKLLGRATRLAKLLKFMDVIERSPQYKLAELEVKLVGGTVEGLGEVIGWDGMKNVGTKLKAMKLADIIADPLALGVFAEIDGKASLKGEVTRASWSSKGAITDPIGLTASYNLTMGLEAGLLNGYLYSLELSGTGKLVAGAALEVDDVGVCITRLKSETTHLSARLRLILAAGSWTSFGEGLDKDDVQQPDTVDLLPFLPEDARKNPPIMTNERFYLHKFASG